MSKKDPSFLPREKKKEPIKNTFATISTKHEGKVLSLLEENLNSTPTRTCPPSKKKREQDLAKNIGKPIETKTSSPETSKRILHLKRCTRSIPHKTSKKARNAKYLMRNRPKAFPATKKHRIS